MQFFPFSSHHNSSESERNSFRILGTVQIWLRRDPRISINAFANLKWNSNEPTEYYTCRYLVTFVFNFALHQVAQFSVMRLHIDYLLIWLVMRYCLAVVALSVFPRTYFWVLSPRTLVPLKSGVALPIWAKKLEIILCYCPRFRSMRKNAQTCISLTFKKA